MIETTSRLQQKEHVHTHRRGGGRKRREERKEADRDKERERERERKTDTNKLLFPLPLPNHSGKDQYKFSHTNRPKIFQNEEAVKTRSVALPHLGHTHTHFPAGRASFQQI